MELRLRAEQSLVVRIDIQSPALDVDVVFVETNDPAGPFGATGVGEPGLVPTAPAIANAVHDAVHDAVAVRIRDLPITPERVLAALERKRRAGG